MESTTRSTSTTTTTQSRTTIATESIGLVGIRTCKFEKPIIITTTRLSSTKHRFSQHGTKTVSAKPRTVCITAAGFADDGESGTRCALPRAASARVGAAAASAFAAATAAAAAAIAGADVCRGSAAVDVRNHLADLLLLRLEAQRAHCDFQLLRIDRARAIRVKQVERLADLLLLLLRQLKLAAVSALAPSLASPRCL